MLKLVGVWEEDEVEEEEEGTTQSTRMLWADV